VFGLDVNNRLAVNSAGGPAAPSLIPEAAGCVEVVVFRAIAVDAEQPSA
jgi:hypothetical protein